MNRGPGTLAGDGEGTDTQTHTQWSWHQAGFANPNTPATTQSLSVFARYSTGEGISQSPSEVSVDQQAQAVKEEATVDSLCTH